MTDTVSQTITEEEETTVKLSVKLSLEFSSDCYNQSKREFNRLYRSQCSTEEHTAGFQETHCSRKFQVDGSLVNY